MALARTTVSIEQNTLERFFSVYPTGMRSKIIQNLIEKDLNAMDEMLANAVNRVETHPDFEQVRADSALWEKATALDGLEKP